MTDPLDMEETLGEDAAFGVFIVDCSECENVWYTKADMTVGESRTFVCDECGHEWDLEYLGVDEADQEREPLSSEELDDIVDRFG